MKSKPEISGKSLIRTVINGPIADGVFAAGEVALDAQLTEGVLKAFPVVGAIINLIRAGQSVRDALFVRKLTRFLLELQSVPTHERQKLLAGYPDGSEAQQTLGENVLLAIDQLDNIVKPTILARFFAAFVKGDIDYTTFTRLSAALSRFNLALFPQLRWFYVRDEPVLELREEIVHELSLAGLVTVALEGSGSIGGGAMYKNAVLAFDFLRIGFKVEFSEPG